MKKVITAINNPKLNEELKKENNFEIIGKDIQYKEAILEVLENNSNIDLIIISEKIPGEINLEKLVNKIKIMNEKIKIIFILEKENEEIEKILIKNKIEDIYYNNKINLSDLIKIINKKEINMEEEIAKLKKIIEEKNINYNNIENNSSKRKKSIREKDKNFIKSNLKKLENRIKNEINVIRKKRKQDNIVRNMSTKIVSFSGSYKSGKTTLALVVSEYLSKRNYKILLVDGDLEKQDLSIILKRYSRKDNKQNKDKNKNFKRKGKGNYFNRKDTIQKENYKKRKNQKEEKKNVLKNNKVNNQTKRKNKNNKLNNKENKIVNIKNKINNQYKKLLNKKNTIYYYKIKEIIGNFTMPINKNFYFFNGLNNILKNSNKKKRRKLEVKIFLLLEIIRDKFDFIVIDLSKSNSNKINREILKKSDINFVFMKANLLGIKEVGELLESYVKKWKINKESLHIVENNKDIISVNKKLLMKSLSLKSKIFEIKENKLYCFLTENYYKSKKILKNKKIKRDINKIVNKIIFK